MKDKIIRGLAYDGKISVMCANTTHLVEEARKIHDLSPVVTAAFGRMITIASMMGAEMKNDTDKLTVQMRGNGPIEMMMATVDSFPKVKGYVVNPHVDIPLNDMGKLDVGEAVGHQGYLNIIKDIGLKDPYVGISPLVSGEVAEDFAEYFVKSEQKGSAVGLGVLVDKHGVRSAGGYLITPMPDATEEDIVAVEQSIFKAGAISKMLDETLSLEEIAKRVTGDENVQILQDDTTPVYECDCSKERMAEVLISIGKQELNSIMEEEENAEIVCHFCHTKYEFPKEELEVLVQEL